MSVAKPDIYDKGYLNQFQLEPLTKLASNRVTEFKDILPWNISQMIIKTLQTSTRIVVSYAMKQGIPF